MALAISRASIAASVRKTALWRQRSAIVDASSDAPSKVAAAFSHVGPSNFARLSFCAFLRVAIADSESMSRLSAMRMDARAVV